MTDAFTAEASVKDGKKKGSEILQKMFLFLAIPGMLACVLAR